MAGRLPETAPLVCVQLPMFNEAEVAARAIEAAAALRWPAGAAELQVLDDSTDAQAPRAFARRTCAEAAERRRRSHKVDPPHRSRPATRPGALEAGRRRTRGQLHRHSRCRLCPASRLSGAIGPAFYRPDGSLIEDLRAGPGAMGRTSTTIAPALTAARPVGG